MIYNYIRNCCPVLALFFFVNFIFVSTSSLSGTEDTESNRLHSPGYLEVEAISESGIVICPVQLQSVLHLATCTREQLATIRLSCDQLVIDSQFIPLDVVGNGIIKKALLVAKFPPELIAKSHKQTLQCEWKFSETDMLSPVFETFEQGEEFTIERPGYAATMRANEQGGFPAKITFTKSGKEYDDLQWHDRVYRSDTGGFILSADSDAQLECSTGSVCTVVRQGARFLTGDGKVNPSGANADYLWLYFNDLPFVYILAQYRQNSHFSWNELHFCELHPGGQFGEWLGITPNETESFIDNQTSHVYPAIAALKNRNDYIAFFGSNVTVYDQGLTAGSYLLMDGPFAWRTWNNKSCSKSGWMMIGNFDDSESYSQIQSLLDSIRPPSVRIVPPSFQQDNPNCFALESRDIRFLFESQFSEQSQPAFGETEQPVELTPDGMGLLGFASKGAKPLSLSNNKIPLFSCVIYDPINETEIGIDSLSGWNKVSSSSDDNGIKFQFTGCSSLSFGSGITVTVSFDCSPERAGVDIGYRFQSDVSDCRLVSFSGPPIIVDDFGASMKGFYPMGPGVVYNNPTKQSINIRNIYPTGFGAAMSWMAVWNDNSTKSDIFGLTGTIPRTNTGLYVAFHDPSGGDKYFHFQSDPGDYRLTLGFEHLLERGEHPITDWSPTGVMHLELFSGDWFDAAQIYRRWVRNEATWYPPLGSDGRPDTPSWMKNLSLWAIGGGTNPAIVPDQMNRFKKAFGVPGALHWYNWHQIPFDNDYPHYFPTHNGFKEAVLEIQKEGDFVVMPYINGRLWDTRDDKTEDRFFSRQALPAVAKQEKTGKPFTETYGSKEEDGSPVVLGVMCPSTEIWRSKVRENVLRLMNDTGVLGVYVDQVAAAGPVSCNDSSHPHPVGAGSWWCPAYWKMFETIRSDIKQELADYPACEEEKLLIATDNEHLSKRMLTTECNAEPFIHIFDGYLTWHWQYQDAVPAFTAVYGDAIVLFGRSYSGNSMAWRMKAAQSLVFGEQIGWFDWNVINDPEKFDYIRALVQFRHHFVPYFYKGQLSRPVTFLDPIPTVTEDWQWAGKTIITAPAVQTGSWLLPSENNIDNSTGSPTMLVVFTNCTDEPVQSRIRLDVQTLGLEPNQVIVRRVESDGSKSDPLPPESLRQMILFPPQTTWGLEITGF